MGTETCIIPTPTPLKKRPTRNCITTSTLASLLMCARAVGELTIAIFTEPPWIAAEMTQTAQMSCMVSLRPSLFNEGDMMRAPIKPPPANKPFAARKGASAADRLVEDWSPTSDDSVPFLGVRTVERDVEVCKESRKSEDWRDDGGAVAIGEWPEGGEKYDHEIVAVAFCSMSGLALRILLVFEHDIELDWRTECRSMRWPAERESDERGTTTNLLAAIGRYLSSPNEWHTES